MTTTTHPATVTPLRETQSPPVRRRRRDDKTRRWLAGIVMWLLAIAFLVPFAWMVSASLKRDIDIFSVPV
ncbi:MAG TPA: hypothetical protein VF062_22910, partial [Candidatus Limnocylindrales bacterium]